MLWLPGLRPNRSLIYWFLPALVATSVAAGDFAYVTNQNSSDLSVLDLRAMVEVDRVSVPGQPAGVVVDVAGGRVFTVSPESKIVRRFDLATMSEAAHIRLDGGPIGIALDPAGGRIFVSDWYNARIWVLDAGNLQIERMLETGSAPAGLTVADDWLASADRDANQVSIFELPSLTLQHRVTVGERPFGISTSPDGRIFAANVGTNSVSVIDPKAGTVVEEIAVGERPYGVAFAMGRGFVSNQYSDTVTVFDAETLDVVKTLDVGEYPEGIDATGDGSVIVVANWFSNTVSLIDPAQLEVIGEIETGDGPRAFGRFIASLEDG